MVPDFQDLPRFRLAPDHLIDSGYLSSGYLSLFLLLTSCVFSTFLFAGFYCVFPCRSLGLPPIFNSVGRLGPNTLRGPGYEQVDCGNLLVIGFVFLCLVLFRIVF